MVKYLTEPTKDKLIDPAPMYYNCDPESIFLDDLASSATNAEPVYSDLVAAVRGMKKAGAQENEVIEMITNALDGERHQWFWQLIKIFQTTPAEVKPKYLPKHLADGSLAGATALQRAACRWLERGPVSEADGLWIKAPQGSGKTLLLNLMQIRYVGEVFPVAERGSTGGYDSISMIRYASQSIVFVNSLKPKVTRGGQTWHHTLLELLEKLTDGLPMNVEWGMQSFSFAVGAKIVAVSTFDRPETKDILRRYSLLAIDGEAGTLSYREHEGNAGTASNITIVPAANLLPASSFAVDDNVAKAIDDGGPPRATPEPAASDPAPAPALLSPASEDFAPPEFEMDSE